MGVLSLPLAPVGGRPVPGREVALVEGRLPSPGLAQGPYTRPLFKLT
jgi:hypothetical protein